jgi:hypothetical protein
LWRNVPACRRISRRRQIHVVEQLSEDGSIDAETERRIAENEVRFRAANEKVKAAGTRLGASEQTLPFVCECGRGECLRVLRLTIPQYEQGRQNARYFLCAPGHEITGEDLGRVVRRERSYLIVEKVGVAGAVAEQTDPRHVRP